MIVKKRVLAWIALTAVHAVCCVWLSGYLFLKFAHIEGWLQPTTATISTWFAYNASYGHETRVKNILDNAATLAFFAFILPVAGGAYLAFKPRSRDLYGNSRLATDKEALAALSADNGILCGQIGKHYLRFGGTQHVLMEAPSRSGKGVGVVIPNLLALPESVVVLDIKQENWNITSEFRRKYGHKCFLFNPACRDYRSHRWNPLGYVSDDYNFRVDDIQKIGAMLFPHDGKSDPFWVDAPRNIFLGICLYLMETPELAFTLGEVYRQSVKLGNRAYFKELAAKRAAKGKGLHPQAVLSFEAFAGLSENTAGSVMGTLQAKLSLWANPVVDAATSANDFDLRNLRREKMAIYIGITPDNLDRLAFLVNLLLQQIFDLNTQELPEDNPELKYSCTFLLDEATAIGKIPILQKGIAYFAGYRLRLVFIIQSVAQLTDLYGEAAMQTFVTNLALRIVFAPKENKVAQEISESIGYVTETNVSTSRSLAGGKNSSRSESQSAVKRAVFWPHELKEIGQDKAILLLDNVRPILCRKIRYYADGIFKQRLLGAAPVPRLELSSAPAGADPLASEMDAPREQVVDVTTPEAANKVTLANIRFTNKDVVLPKPKTDDPKAFAEEYLAAIGLASGDG